MKKKTNLLALAMMGTMILAGCGNTNQTTTDEASKPVAQTQSTEDKASAADQKSSNDQSSNVTSDKNSKEDTKTSAENNSGLTSLDSLKVSPEDAESAFFEKYPNAQIKSFKLDQDHNVWKYKIEAFEDQTEYEVYVDADSKEVTENEKEQGEDNSDEQTFKLADAKIKPQEALDKALEEANDSNATLDSLKLKFDSGKLVYEVEFNTQNGDVDVDIDANDGSVVEVDR
ncbi:MAG: PepSY domain-containing protein [Tissierellia bacterium]|nr:PepSY domain-containing protein [Tissierellia bacterium]